MADNRKERERDELHRTIRGIANDLRGSVDGWDFKQYALGMLFYRYISENFANYINDGEREAGDATFDYAQLSDSDAEQARDDLIKTKGFFILPSQLFCSVRSRAPLDENLNETLEAVFQAVEDSAKGSDSEANFSGLFDDIDVNSNKLGGTVAERNKRLVKLMNGVGDMKLGDYRDNTIDAFGDAYEYLMGMYASNAGKSGGEYFTPQEGSELLTRIAVAGKTEVNNEEVKRELANIIRELKDTRIPLMTSVVTVNVTNDLRYAKAYISVMGDEETKKKAMQGLKSAAGFIRRELGKRIDLRYTPEFVFELDDSIEHGANIERLLNNINKK